MPRVKLVSQRGAISPPSSRGSQKRLGDRRSKVFGRGIGAAHLMLRELESTAQLQALRWEPSAHGRLLKLLLPAIRPQASSRAQQIVREMLRFVDLNCDRPIGLSEVATALRMNAAYLSTLFSHTLGMTFHGYLSEYRLSRAKQLLRQPLRRVCEIACAVGYASPCAFRHAFKASTGLSPSEWRQRL
jgi:AraC-like DNA-binding protein